MKKIIVVGASLGLGLMFATAVFAADVPTLTVFGGRAVSNSVSDLKSNAWGVEQETPTKLGMWDFGYVNEGHQNGDKRDGICAMKAFDYQFAPKVQTSFAVGPYFTATTITAADGNHYQDHYRWAALASARVKYNVTEHWSVTGNRSHVLYRAGNKDADLFLIGVGYSPSN